MAEMSKATTSPKASGVVVEGGEEEVPNLNLSHITDGETERGIPLAKFIDDVDEFANSFRPPASAELLIGAYSDMMNRYRVYESKLARKRKFVLSYYHSNNKKEEEVSALGQRPFNLHIYVFIYMFF